MTCTRSSGSSARSRSTWKPAGPPACRAGARSRSSRCCSCTAATPSTSTASWTSCGRAPGPQNARNAVQVVASRLRAALGEDLVRSEGGGYAVRLPPGALDADRFEERFRLGREELARGDPREAAATLREALALWRGPALADVADERFAQPEIARLEDLRLGCLSERIEADLACGRHAEVAGELEALVREHPLRERLRGQLMLALYRAGPPGRRARRVPRRAPRARRRARHRALAGPARAGGGDPAPGGPGARAAAETRRRARAPTRRRWVTCVVSQLAGPDAPGLDPESLHAVVERFHATGRAVFAQPRRERRRAAQRRRRRGAGHAAGARRRRAARAACRGGAARRAPVRRAAPAPAPARSSPPATRR